MYARNYGTDYYLIDNGRILSEEEALIILSNNLSNVGLSDNNGIGISFDGTHLVPTVNGMAQTHLAPTFTVKVKGEAEVKKASKSRRTAVKARRIKSTDKDEAEYAAEYIREYGTIHIEGIGGCKTNYGNGYTLTINSGDADEARRMAEVFTVIVNNDKNEGEGVYKLTCMAEVGAVMEAIGLGNVFHSVAETIKKGQVWTKKLSEYAEMQAVA